MSEAMKGTIAAVYEAIESGNHDALDACFHEAVTYRRPGSAVIAGRGAVMHYYRKERPAATSRILVDLIVTDGDQAVAMGLVEGRARDGAPIHERFADAYLFADGLIRDRTTYFFRGGF